MCVHLLNRSTRPATAAYALHLIQVLLAYSLAVSFVLCRMYAETRHIAQACTSADHANTHTRQARSQCSSMLATVTALPVQAVFKLLCNDNRR
jgi:uncharacterized protein (UPF0333 family)